MVRTCNSCVRSNDKETWISWAAECRLAWGNGSRILPVCELFVQHLFSCHMVGKGTVVDDQMVDKEISPAVCV